MMAGLHIYLINSLLKVLAEHRSRRVKTKLEGLLYRNCHPHRFLLQRESMRKYFSCFREGFCMSLGKGERVSCDQLQPQLSFLPCQAQLKSV